ncbi:hypothetical protein HK096_004665 [Nowakowskiella sp. JEL0078]|nr:hypothetical protein HK096_004665 [Nowakowskiella sp. JEL0078]
MRKVKVLLVKSSDIATEGIIEGSSVMLMQENESRSWLRKYLSSFGKRNEDGEMRSVLGYVLTMWIIWVYFAIIVTIMQVFNSEMIEWENGDGLMIGLWLPFVLVGIAIQFEIFFQLQFSHSVPHLITYFWIVNIVPDLIGTILQNFQANSIEAASNGYDETTIFLFPIHLFFLSLDTESSLFWTVLLLQTTFVILRNSGIIRDFVVLKIAQIFPVVTGEEIRFVFQKGKSWSSLQVKKIDSSNSLKLVHDGDIMPQTSKLRGKKEQKLDDVKILHNDFNVALQYFIVEIIVLFLMPLSYYIYFLLLWNEVAPTQGTANDLTESMLNELLFYNISSLEEHWSLAILKRFAIVGGCRIVAHILTFIILQNRSKKAEEQKRREGIDISIDMLSFMNSRVEKFWILYYVIFAITMAASGFCATTKKENFYKTLNMYKSSSLEKENPDNIVNDINGLMLGLKSMEEEAAKYHALSEQLHTLEQSCVKEISNQKKRLSELKKKAKAVAPNLSKENKVKLSDDIFMADRKFRHVEYQFPRSALLILKLALGSSAPFALRPKKLRFEYKREYEEFKLRFTLVATALAAFNLFVSNGRIPNAIYMFTLLYYFCTCTLREHILWVNGSKIRSWWFGHHYLSIILAAVLLVRVIQFMQYRYQRSRLYVLVALDRVESMATVMGDGVHTQQLDREIFLILPFLIVGQLWQLHNAYKLFELYVSQEVDKKEWQVALACILFFMLGVGNMFTTLKTWFSKRLTRSEKDYDSTLKDQ